MAESPTVKRRRLGMLLKEFRVAAGMTTEQAAAELDRTDSWVSKIERGRSGLTRIYLEKILDLYRVGEDVRAELTELAKGGRQRGWWSKYSSILSKQYSAYIGFEAEASRLLIYEGMVVHGLLQTSAYARAAIRAGNPDDATATVDRKVEVRLNRQKRLVAEQPLRLQVVFDEAVLHRIVSGNRQVHLAQLDHLLDLADEDNECIHLQVIPFDDNNFPGMLPSFTLLEFRNDPELVYIETVTGDLYEDPPDTHRYRMTFENLRAAALSESSTRELIRRVRAEIAARA
ncbi:helix-turn-helix domain-containing protein [Actinocatenispora sera]|uniref:Transcriptional regulator n=1 Tax=Actinocatenispora sera TaxID=390989 RepID=A0A810LCY3_9ACTN|nr:helix-turn-helix transcriptional regulator [Actinocatenispora sera]BCJ32096.1 transcriptional regulator [Actinocatenispora sera]